MNVVSGGVRLCWSPSLKGKWAFYSGDVLGVSDCGVVFLECCGKQV